MLFKSQGNVFHSPELKQIPLVRSKEPRFFGVCTKHLVRLKVKGKLHPITGYKGPEEE